ncbi:hypothetical protein EYC98_14050 [Halieaceae bacterium IMCC14734]|uniref:Uncharacterized protein n=1 Tax=Candidatus Litorirhabdus singularis TaxID=2518993 RepID=A0ABT3TI72_9GAMM|nr:hypothetical protein [Candidatus Litorirhabdus singularis]MCX2981981.1 hypothetical protein [Candidatus Litorirhabdus singularis]
MSETFLVCNQLQQFWGKKKAWVDGSDRKRILCNKHEDEAVNLLVELSSKDIDLRGQVTPAELDDKGLPVVEPSAHRIVEVEIPVPESTPESVTTPVAETADDDARASEITAS